VEIHRDRWRVPPIFSLIGRLGQVSDEEMHRVFNMGVGFLFVLGPEDAEGAVALDLPDSLGLLGEVVEGEGPVSLI
jgi:phosphoribosylformylglycinamidine cyclo-ligase